MPYKIFLSHASADRPLAEALHDYCQTLGSLEIYMYEHDVQPGQHVWKKLETALRESEAVIILYTPHSVASKAVQQEIGLAEGAQKLLIPLMQKGTDTSNLCVLEGREWLPFDPEDPEHGFDHVKEYFQHLSDQQGKRMQLQAVANGAALALLVFALLGFMFYLTSRGKRQ